MAEMRHCFMCGRTWPKPSMWTLDGWEQLYYVCVPCVDVMRDHAGARLREQEHEQDPASDRAGEPPF